MVKRGDIFRVGDDQQLYLVDATTQGGSVYARKYDVTKGGYGEPVLLKKDAILNVLSNETTPEQVEGWEYCTIKHQTIWKDDWIGDECFIAEIKQQEKGVIVEKSASQLFVRGEPTLTFPNDQNRAIHQALVNKLTANGWQVVLERQLPWFQVRLKRKT